MKKLILFVAVLLVIGYNPNAQVNPKTNYVKGYTKKNGTYVQPYVRTQKNTTIIDNYSTKPNVNPYTGKVGTVTKKK